VFCVVSSAADITRVHCIQCPLDDGILSSLLISFTMWDK
jgi:hypothetical protein